MYWTEYLQLGYYGTTLLGMFLLVYKNYIKSEDKTNKSLAISEVVCKANHYRINEILAEFKDSFSINTQTFAKFRENDFRHIEENTGKINERMARMEGQIDTMLKVMTDVLNKK
jgi:uncharacterized membrane protein